MPIAKNHDDGFTLVEVLMAIIVLGIGIAGLMTAFGMQIKTSLTNRNQAASESLLTAAAEYVKALSFTSNGSHCELISGSVPPTAVSYDPAEFNVTYAGSQLGSESPCSIQQVLVKVNALSTKSTGFSLSVTVVKRPSIEPTP